MVMYLLHPLLLGNDSDFFFQFIYISYIRSQVNVFKCEPQVGLADRTSCKRSFSDLYRICQRIFRKHPATEK